MDGDEGEQKWGREEMRERELVRLSQQKSDNYLDRYEQGSKGENSRSEQAE